MLFDFGDFIDNTTSTASPYVQLLSTTNPAKAHQDFVNARLGGNSTARNITHNSQDLSSSFTSSSPSSWWSSLSSTKKDIVIGLAAAVALMLVLAVSFYLCSRRGGGRAAAGTGAMGFGGNSYKPLHEPAPNAAYETYALPNLEYNQYQYGQTHYQPTLDRRY